MDDNLGQMIARGGFCPENENAWRDVEVGVMQQPTVKGKHVQKVKMLALVLVQPLDLRIKRANTS